ncbi:hypothetical protein DLAC_11687 [Tieghemostelium lacteum]|uniref:Transmembrane protein n=1 Tax=Tieghemostelium lacteum TaxID=361077 RepID=A0A151ZCH3_TIELA|nr:hypothetical protein DLAC_11687 [Tieghemostelium lacteum]|eukprot:KYQ91653.1 hypothetical protein DLAC_11687 [Tieghemostelium lacteum]
MNYLFILIISTVISTIVVYTLDVWRLRIQIYPIIKRFFTFYYHLLYKRDPNNNKKIAKSKRHLDECFIDEFGWNVFIRGLGVNIIVQIFIQLLIAVLYHPLILWRSKPYSYYTELELGNVTEFDMNNKSIILTILSSVSIGIVGGFVTFQSQHFSIELQFQFEKLQPHHRNTRVKHKHDHVNFF